MDYRSDRQRLLDDLYSYPLRTYPAAFLWWLFTGFAGGHRYYLGDLRKGMLMTLTGGGLLVWWLYDVTQLRKWVNDYNSKQMYRRTNGLVPVELDFLPSLNAHTLDKPASWLQTEVAPNTLRKELILLFIMGYFVGLICNKMSTFEPLVGLGAISLLLLGANTLYPFSHLKVVQELLQWDLKLQLFYHENGIGKAKERLWRPFVGVFTLLFQEKRTAEARLYVDICFAVTFFFIIYSLATGEYFTLLVKREYTDLISTYFKESAISFFLVYTCVTPLGATLIQHRLKGTPVWEGVVIVAVMTLGIYLGL